MVSALEYSKDYLSDVLCDFMRFIFAELKVMSLNFNLNIEGNIQNLQLVNGPFMTISSNFFADFIDICKKSDLGGYFVVLDTDIT